MPRFGCTGGRVGREWLQAYPGLKKHTHTSHTALWDNANKSMSDKHYMHYIDEVHDDFQESEASEVTKH